MNVLSGAIEATLRVTSVLESLSVRYVVGGSLASSLQGIPRATQDVDVVAAMQEEHVDPFVTALGGTFYVDRDMVLDAVRTDTSSTSPTSRRSSRSTCSFLRWISSSVANSPAAFDMTSATRAC